MGSDKNVDQLDAMRQRAADTIEKWACQTREASNALPETVQDMKVVSRYAAMMGANELISLRETFDALDSAVEAAYNLGKAEATFNTKPQQPAKATV